MEKTKQKKAENPRRAQLRELSDALRPLVRAGVYDSINDGLMANYQAATGQTEWNTFHGWKDAGQMVKKGESGFPIWGKPRHLKPADGATGGDLAALAALNGIEPQGPEFFPVCYLFHAGQVQAMEEAQLAA